MNRFASITFLTTIMCSSSAFAGAVETIEVIGSQTARMGATNCCTLNNSLSGYGGTYTSTGNCQSVYGSCVQSKRAAFWLFDLSSLPEGATVISASFDGQTEYSDQSGSATFSVKGVSGSLTNSMAQSVMSSPNWSSNAYFWGGTFSRNIPASNVESARDLGGLVIYLYVSTTNTVSIHNTGNQAARLTLEVEIDSPIGACCLSNGYCAEIPQYNCESGSNNTFHGPGSICGSDNTCPSDGCDQDTNGDGAVDVNDLLEVISSWGTCSGCTADTNDDGHVDIIDLLSILDGWGDCG